MFIFHVFLTPPMQYKKKPSIINFDYGFLVKNKKFTEPILRNNLKIKRTIGKNRNCKTKSFYKKNLFCIFVTIQK